eukprot:Hpha_TRINITY_DN16679_c2_g13::TRINITY_DN16679_c2_g13_i1::g.181099::m.181099
MGYCGRFIERLVRPGDTLQDARIKRKFFPVAVLLVALACTTCSLALRDSTFAGALGVGFSGLGPAIIVVGILTNAASASRLLEVALYVSTMGIIIMDVTAAALSDQFRPWAYIILTLDCSLVFNIGHFPMFCIPFTLVYLLMEHVESVYRYGLYELGYWGISEEASFCNCASPPCSLAAVASLTNYLGVCIVCLVDFYLTKGFENGMTLQLHRIQVSAGVVEEVAAALARYDVDSAEETITGARDLPEGLEKSFRQLLSNLKSYRSYLPDSLLHPDDTGEELGGGVPPPMGDADGEVEVGM